MSNLESCSSISERVKFGGGPRSPCILKKITPVLSEAKLTALITVHSTSVLLFSTLAGMDKVEKIILPPILVSELAVTPLDAMSGLGTAIPSTVQTIVLPFPEQLKSTFELGSRAEL